MKDQAGVGTERKSSGLASVVSPAEQNDACCEGKES